MSDLPDLDPPADPDETALLAEMEALLEAQQEPAEPEPTEEPKVEAEPEGEPEPVGEPEAVPPIPSGLTDTEVEQLRQIRDSLASDPALRQRIVDYYQGQQAERAPEPEPLPALNLDDPDIAALHDRYVAQQNEITQLRSQADTINANYVAQQRAQSEALYNRAAESFRKEHDLDATQVKDLSGVAARLGLLPALMQGVDPFTGLPVQPDPLSAVERALEIAYYNDPKYREHESRRLAEARHKQDTKRQRLAAVSGSSGSAPRAPAPVATGSDAKRAQMVKEVAESMFQ